MNLVLKSVDKFTDPLFTADGQKRASVELQSLETLWFNTGSLCNLSCNNCYIESDPHNDRLAYLTLEDVRTFLDEIKTQKLQTKADWFYWRGALSKSRLSSDLAFDSSVGDLTCWFSRMALGV